ncbi:probable G-protein coupled receptor No9 [Exaiptasia diaphana]|uniref:G-protein coupled receptors family 1 profile domain-containing protein n=1 Tax=Exaiptasia diaphana TaxID=2652724 RepID=A0A913YJU0_EXADI|nr:probable G-protein coupled receptor No9 [Exaiptasia diaphana]XP_028515298.1 probable G-protein coupled receptor No9 [Exaiptasia diaphana]XP_028515299.1 probable G-protein coupled receptor No9 [Exaiptasia diaphana]
MVSNNTNQTTLPRVPGLGPFELTMFLIFAIVLCAVVIFNNLLVIVAARINPRLRRGTYSLFTSLAVSDFLVGAVSMPLWIYMNIVSATNMTKAVLQFYIVFDIFSAMASILHLVSVSVDRYLAVSKPEKHRLVSSSSYRNTIGCLWIFAALISCLYPIQHGFKAYYTILLFAFGFIIPLIVISSMYIKIFRVSHKLIAPLERRQSKEDLKRHLRKEHQLARTGALVTGLFSISWIPFFTVSVVATFCRSCLHPVPGFDFRLTAFVKFMHYGNSAMNTFIYAFLNMEMKRTFIRLFKGLTTELCADNIMESYRRTRRMRQVRINMNTRRGASKE